MIGKFDQYKQRIVAMQKQLDEEKRAAVAGVLADIRECVRLFGLTPRDIFGDMVAVAARRRPAPKYRDPASGRTWSGIGRAPAWIRGKDRAAFTIERASAPPAQAALAEAGKARAPADAPGGKRARARKPTSKGTAARRTVRGL